MGKDADLTEVHAERLDFVPFQKLRGFVSDRESPSRRGRAILLTRSGSPTVRFGAGWIRQRAATLSEPPSSSSIELAKSSRGVQRCARPANVSTCVVPARAATWADSWATKRWGPRF